jgi:glutamine amidotransferase
MKIGIIEYGLGNLRSVQEAVRKCGYDAVITRSPDELAKCSKLILPGVGAFEIGMKNIHSLGLVECLTEFVMLDKKPLLAICLGFQMLANRSDERGNHKGLGWINAQVKEMSDQNGELRIPHIGWNDTDLLRPSVLWGGMPQSPIFYYVHGFHVDCIDESTVLARCNYGIDFVAAIRCGNIVGTQFHPEKSQKAGLQFIKNFIESI